MYFNLPFLTQDNLIFFEILAGVIALDIIILIYVFYLHRKFKRYFTEDGKDFSQMLENQIRDLRRQKEEIGKIKEHIAKLREISRISFQKYAMVRFNPFQEVGSDQSFSIALLDEDNNGFVITSHFGRDFNKIYSKPITAGKSEYSLSKEEETVISKAIHGASNALADINIRENKTGKRPRKKVVIVEDKSNEQ